MVENVWEDIAKKWGLTWDLHHGDVLEERIYGGGAVIRVKHLDTDNFYIVKDGKNIYPTKKDLEHPERFAVENLGIAWNEVAKKWAIKNNIKYYVEEDVDSPGYGGVTFTYNFHSWTFHWNYIHKKEGGRLVDVYTHGSGFRGLAAELVPLSLLEEGPYIAQNLHVVYRTGVVSPEFGRKLKVVDRRGNAIEVFELKMYEEDEETLAALKEYISVEPYPRPWHAAQPGEIWEVMIGGKYHWAEVSETPEQTVVFNIRGHEPVPVLDSYILERGQRVLEVQWWERSS